MEPDGEYSPEPEEVVLRLRDRDTGKQRELVVIDGHTVEDLTTLTFQQFDRLDTPNPKKISLFADNGRGIDMRTARGWLRPPPWFSMQMEESAHTPRTYSFA